MTIEERIAELWRNEKANPRREREREPASPWKVYQRFPRRCTICGKKELVRDGQYFCRDHHPDAKAMAA